jgi:fumarate reductase subunit C
MKKWKDKNPKERKYFLIRLIGGIGFLLVGLIFAIISLVMNGWNFADFISNPTFLLVVLLALALGITFISWAEVK